MSIKVATFNVNGIKSRMPRLLEWLHHTKPDIACLQEVKTGDATFPKEAIEVKCTPEADNRSAVLGVPVCRARSATAAERQDCSRVAAVESKGTRPALTDR